MNVGERDELIFKLIMIDYRDRGKCLFDKKINNVGFLKTEYPSLPDGFSCDDLRHYSDAELTRFVERLGVSKSPTRAKADIFINGTGYSVKSLAAAPAALVNHTARPGFEKACSYAGVSIEVLDEIVDEYWRLREQGVIKEDTKIVDPNCPFIPYKEQLKPVLEYFLFDGTGGGKSVAPADYIIEFSNPLDEKTYRLLDKEDAVEEIWPKLVFSMRAKKGMPKNYNPNTYHKPNADSIKRWVRYSSGDFRGALHIRVTR